MITGRKLRAARNLLDWTQNDLAEHSDVALSSISQFEAEHQTLSQKSIDKIINALMANGIVFTPHGIEHHDEKIRLCQSFIEVLEDAQAFLAPGDEILMHCADERRSTQEATDKIKELTEKGIQIKMTYCEGNGFMTLNPENYRWIDKNYFASADVSVIYKTKYVLHVEGEQKTFIIIDEKNLADAMRRQFEYWWKQGRTWDQEKKQQQQQ